MTLTTTKPLILASSSPRRQELIRSLQLPYQIIVSDVDETTEPGLTPEQIVEQLSGRKASAVYERCKADLQELPEGIIIGSDTIVVLNEEILGKPKDEADAFRMLKSLQGREHHVYSGVACIDLQTGVQHVAHQRTAVWMKELTDERIRRYMATGEPMDKAGSYAIQGLGATIVERIEGDYFNVVGLPMSLLSDMLERFSVAVF
ncbi:MULTISPECIES: Maf family protein [unclassified Paenibacillus]|uniref:Maf family protein n=1 Tax=unclassified Paenibacillus TaxID=185978 RepID=UPI001AE89DB7|nr:MULTISPECIES: Maf family protein [unclassified Paenibacillus]MBP1156591.1 septum formation protein [Paenibacillus sp. PvP091]MBP1172671.1 septum formation protein [Paenibacillus sp. PvR098]MBP2439051.1 septum formation protein [Paenibacillus sp. PvP052]